MVGLSRCTGVGIGWRSELAHELLVRRTEVDFVEVVAESCYLQSRARREALAAAEVWPVVPHGVKLSLGSAEGIDDERARRLGDLARALRAPLVSEHVAFTGAGGREVGHLTQLPRSRAAVRVVARNVARARRYLPEIPLLLENIAWTMRWPEDEMDEASFYAEVVAATGCPLLLDLSNLHANALNEGRDPLAVLARYPLEAVAMVHVAGGEWQADGCGRFFFDDHASPVPEPVFALLAALTQRVGSVPVLLERDAKFPPFAELVAELARLRRTGAGAEPSSAPHRWAAGETGPPGLPLGTAPAGDGDESALAQLQGQLARVLGCRDEPIPTELAAFGALPLERTRAVLQRKRIDDALPLLPRLLVHAAVVPVAEKALLGHARSPRNAALADAWTIAIAAGAEPILAAAARADLLLLRARFRTPPAPGAAPRARLGPFLGATALTDGRRLWAMKGLGAHASVRTIER